MILVCVGNDPLPFDRLMGWLDLLREEGMLEEEVVLQSGATHRIPAWIHHHHHGLTDAELRSRALAARAVVAHCDEAMLQALERLEVPFLLVPRTRRLGEAVDDHQVELATALASLGVPIAWAPADLVRFLEAPRPAVLGNLSGGAALALCASLLRRFPPESTPSRRPGR